MTRYLNIQKYGNWLCIAAPLVVIPILYKKNIFQLTSKSLSKDFLVVVGSIGFMEGGQYSLNHFMWQNVQEDVKLYGMHKQQEMTARYSFRVHNRNEHISQDDLLEDEASQ